MKFKKGESGNPNGRPKGAKDKRTEAWEQLGDYLISEGADRYLQVLADSKDKDFMFYYNALLEYFKPKLQRSEVKQETTNKTINVIEIDGVEIEI